MKKVVQLFSTVLIFLFSTVMIQAQDLEVQGIITDGNNGETIIGATILISGTSLGTATDIDGNYSLKINQWTDTLVVSSIGYETLNIPVQGRRIIDITMYEKNNLLDEIVVVGYGRQKKKVVTGAIASVSDEEINSTPVLRVEQALQGRTAGVQVTSQSGQPGDEPTVRVRGTGTTGNSKPLYIVDGMAVGGIDYLNPGDIESIDVLKDAASAAIYGARAANGVVLVTTKKGKEGRMNVNYDAYYGMQNESNRLEMLNADQYKMLMNEGAANAGLSEPFDLNEIAAHDTDWQEALFQKNAPMMNHQVSVTGGSEKSTFASTMSYFTQEGIIGGSKSQFDRFTVRINSAHKVNKIFSFGNNLAYTHLIKRGIGANQSFNGAYSSALNLDPLTPLYQEDENILDQYPYSIEPVVTNQAGQTYGISDLVSAEVVNPLALLEIGNNEIRKDEIVGNIYAQLDPVKGLSIRTSIGVDLAYVLDDSFKPLFFLNGAQLNDNSTSVNKKIERYFTWQWENTINYEKQINDHTIGILGGMTASEFKFEDLSGFNTKVPVTDPDNVYLDQAIDTLWTAGGGARHSALYSLFARANYSFKDKYSFTAILRRDGSSKFGANSRFGVFPSVGMAWIASEEAFLADRLGPINFLKVRASWGINGNQEIGDYQFVSTINNGRGYGLGSGTAVGSSPNFIENEDIHWEESEQLNFGLDMALLENRVTASIDYYIKDTKDLLEKIPIPGHVGNDGPTANVGSVQNKGVEWSINWRNADNKLGYSLGLNGAINRNKMTFIGNTEKVITGASWALAGAVTRSEEGLPIAYFWGYTTDGLFQNETEVFQHINLDGEVLQPNAKPGDVRFVDVNSDGEINEDDRTMIGNPTPDFTLGFTASLDYGGWDFSMFVQGSFGNDIFNGTQRQDLRYTNRPTSSLDRWTGEGTSNSVPRFTWIDTNNNSRVSDLYIEDGSYARLKNIQIGYNFPLALRNKIGAANLRLYVSAENMITLTKYTGIDPEIGAISSFDIGIDRGVYPQAKIVRFGLNASF